MRIAKAMKTTAMQKAAKVIETITTTPQQKNSIIILNTTQQGA